MLFELFRYHQVRLQGRFQNGFVVAALGQVRQVGANAAAFRAKAVAGHAESGRKHLFAIGQATARQWFLLEHLESGVDSPGNTWAFCLGQFGDIDTFDVAHQVLEEGFVLFGHGSDRRIPDLLDVACEHVATFLRHESFQFTEVDLAVIHGPAFLDVLQAKEKMNVEDIGIGFH